MERKRKLEKRMRIGFVVVLGLLFFWGGDAFGEVRGEGEGEVLGVSQALEEEEDEVFDPLEIGNRIFFDIFMLGYYVGIHPWIGVYNGVVPQVVRDRVDDFGGFVRMPLTIVNDVLQGNGRGLQKTVERTAKGVPTLGFYDPDREESPRRFEDYGQTLGVYGVPEGPYVAFPLAPTVRDTTMFVGRTLFLDPLSYVLGAPIRLGLLGIRMTSLFSNLDRGITTLYPSVDGYALFRDLSLRQRRKAVEMRGEDRVELERREEDFDLDIDEEVWENMEEGEGG